MSPHYRLVSFVAVFAALFAALGQYRPAWAADLSLDWWSLPGMRDEMRRSEEQGAALGRYGDRLLACRAAKEQVTGELLAGRLTLTEAAARFRDLDASRGAPAPRRWDHVRGAAQEEHWCRQVIDWAEATAEGRGPRGSGRTTRLRLETELRRLLQEGRGKVVLPTCH